LDVPKFLGERYGKGPRLVLCEVGLVEGCGVKAS